MSKKIKVSLVHNIMAPYKLPLFNILAKQKEIDFEVLFLSKSAINRRWSLDEKNLGFKYKILPKLAINFTGKDFLTYIINYTFPIEFFKKKFDVLVTHGWLDFATQIGFFLCKMTGRKFIVWSESSPNENSWRRTITLPLVKMMVRGADACIAIGSLSKKYFEILGVDPSKIFVAYYTMDLKHFIQNSRMSEKNKMAIKERMGIQRGKVVLYVGQFIERKGVDYLVTAFKKLQTKVPNVSLLLVGYGPQKELLLKRIKDEKIDRVIFQDHIDVEEMPKMYGIADLFVLPSFEEAWGVVVNEAMAAGLPVITTRKVGSSADLVFNNRNGFVIPERNSQALAAALIKILKSPSLRKRMSQESKKIIKNFTPESTAENFLEAIKYSMKP